MNKIEKISLSYALKSSKPFINFCFYPLPFDKYVTMDFSKDPQSLCYNHWQDVVDIIKPYLDENNIRILRLGDANSYQVDGIQDYTSKTFNQNAYILKNSMLHFGSNGLLSFLSSNLGIPLVSLFSGIPSSLFPFPENSKRIFIDSPKDGKNPSFSDYEFPKTIDKIDPCEISRSILNLLNISHQLESSKLIFQGDMSNIKTIEIIPDFFPSKSLLPGSLINVRADLFLDEQNIFGLSQSNRRLGIITKDRLSAGLLSSISKSVQRITINADEGIDEKFLFDLKMLNIPYEFFVTKKDRLKELRLDHIDETIELFEKPKKPLAFKVENSHNAYVKSSKILLSKLGSFPTKAHWICDKKSEGVFQEYIDSSDFWEDSDFINIYQSKNEIV